MAQIDLPASLRGLNKLDRKSRSTLRKIRCSKAVVMLHTAVELPFLHRPDFQYLVYVVSPGLRPEDPEQGYTADMCVPIFPNTDHPTGRTPVRTVPEFPFFNCYHWFGPDISLKVRIKNGTYALTEDPRYIRLDTGDYVDMEIIHQQDILRIFKERAEREKSAAPPAHEESRCPQDGVEVDHSQPEAIHNSDSKSAGECDMEPQDDDESLFGCPLDSSETDSLASGPSDPYAESANHSRSSLSSAMTTSSRGAVKSLTESDLFERDWSVERSRIPVITVSFDLAAQFKEEDIPSPKAFLEECRTFSRMVTDLQEREAQRRSKSETRRRKFEEVSDKIARAFKYLLSSRSRSPTA